MNEETKTAEDSEKRKVGSEMTDDEIFEALHEKGLLGPLEYVQGEEEKTIVKYCQDCLNAVNIAYSIRTSNGFGKFGLCDYRKRKIVLAELSFVYCKTMKSMARFKDTVLHEVAHACRPSASHKEPWKKLMRKIGASPESHHPIPLSVKEAIPYKFILLDKESGLALQGWSRNSKRVKEWMANNGPESKTICRPCDGQFFTFAK